MKQLKKEFLTPLFLILVQGVLIQDISAAASSDLCENLKNGLDLILNNEEIPHQLELALTNKTGRELFYPPEETVGRIKDELELLKKARASLDSCNVVEAQRYIREAIEKNQGNTDFFFVIADNKKAGVENFSLALKWLDEGRNPFDSLYDAKSFLIPGNYKASLKAAVDWLIQQHIDKRPRSPVNNFLQNAKKAIEQDDLLEAQWNLLRLREETILSGQQEDDFKQRITNTISGRDPWERSGGYYYE